MLMKFDSSDWGVDKVVVDGSSSHSYSQLVKHDIFMIKFLFNLST